MPQPQCSVRFCRHRAQGKHGLCAHHRRRSVVHGDTLVHVPLGQRLKKSKPPKKRCAVASCTSDTDGYRPYCGAHAKRLEKRGRLDEHIPIRKRKRQHYFPAVTEPAWSRAPELADPPPANPTPSNVRYLPIVAEPVVTPDHWRPATRGDCKDAPRPCPYFGCRHHLALEVSANGGVRFRDVDLEAMTDTCSLDVADRGPSTLEEIADLFGVVRERTRQIEAKALEHIRRIDGRRGGEMKLALEGLDDREPSLWEQMG